MCTCMFNIFFSCSHDANSTNEMTQKKSNINGRDTDAAEKNELGT